MRRAAVLCAVLGACGRVGFDPRTDADGDDGAILVGGVHYGKASNPGMGDQLGSSVAISADGSTIAVAAFSEASAAFGINGDQTSDAAPLAGAVYVFVRSGSTWVQQAYVKASNTAAGDQFGRSIALSADGSTLAVGANRNDDFGLDAGIVYIFVRSGSTWTEQAILNASNADAGDDFGTHLALSGSGDLLAVGAFDEDSNATGIGGTQISNAAPAAGAVYTFRRVGTAWSPEAYIKASNTDATDRFGEKVALSDDGLTLAVGAPLEDSIATGINGNEADNSVEEAGAVYVFVYAGAWTQQAYVKPLVVDQSSPLGAFDQFGWSVALSSDGNTLAVGARIEQSSRGGVGADPTDNAAPSSGAAYIFTRAGTTWSQQVYIKAPFPDTDDFYGESIDVSGTGDVLVVGAPQEDSGSQTDGGDDSLIDAGAAYVYRRTGTAWALERYVKAPNPFAGDVFSAVALARDAMTLVVGASGSDGGAAGIDGDPLLLGVPDAGAFYIYE